MECLPKQFSGLPEINQPRLTESLWREWSNRNMPMATATVGAIKEPQRSILRLCVKSIGYRKQRVLFFVFLDIPYYYDKLQGVVFLQSVRLYKRLAIL
jgi:CMP-2-keto-3-deoxyoctulosonic acid synthetase